MSQHRKALWDADLDEDLQDVDLNLAIGNYGQNGLYEDGLCLQMTSRLYGCLTGYLVLLAQSRINEAALIAVQQQMAQQAAFQQIPDAVRRVSSRLQTRLLSAIGLKDL